MTLVHPLVVSVRCTGRTETPDGYAQTYRIKDHLPLGRLTLPISYAVSLWVPRAGEVTAEVRQSPAVRLRTPVTFEPVAGGTRVTERIRITAPRPLASLTATQATAAHVTMLSAIGRYFDG